MKTVFAAIIALSCASLPAFADAYDATAFSRPEARACRRNSDCGLGESCVRGVCQSIHGPSGCRVDSDCGPGLSCRGGMCTEDPHGGGCYMDADCGPGYLCRFSSCVPDTH